MRAIFATFLTTRLTLGVARLRSIVVPWLGKEKKKHGAARSAVAAPGQGWRNVGFLWQLDNICTRKQRINALFGLFNTPRLVYKCPNRKRKDTMTESSQPVIQAFLPPHNTLVPKIKGKRKRKRKRKRRKKG